MNADIAAAEGVALVLYEGRVAFIESQARRIEYLEAQLAVAMEGKND